MCTSTFFYYKANKAPKAREEASMSRVNPSPFAALKGGSSVGERMEGGGEGGGSLAG